MNPRCRLISFDKMPRTTTASSSSLGLVKSDSSVLIGENVTPGLVLFLFLLGSDRCLRVWAESDFVQDAGFDNTN